MLKLFKAKSLKKTQETEKISLNERTQEKEKSKGRSMVEMLGVLAIIGVLSIGGIQGYTMAMRKYRANEILNIANKYATLYYTACQNAMEKDPKNYYIYDGDTGLGFGGMNGIPWKCPNMNFADTGLGPIPQQGITLLIPNLGVATALDPNEKYPQSTGVAEGTDYVVVNIGLKSKALCETLFSMVNTEIMNNDVNSLCADDEYSNVLATFTMN